MAEILLPDNELPSLLEFWEQKHRDIFNQFQRELLTIIETIIEIKAKIKGEELISNTSINQDLSIGYFSKYTTESDEYLPTWKWRNKIKYILETKNLWVTVVDVRDEILKHEIDLVEKSDQVRKNIHRELKKGVADNIFDVSRNENDIPIYRLKRVVGKEKGVTANHALLVVPSESVLLTGSLAFSVSENRDRNPKKLHRPSEGSLIRT